MLDGATHRGARTRPDEDCRAPAASRLNDRAGSRAVPSISLSSTVSLAAVAATMDDRSTVAITGAMHGRKRRTPGRCY